MKTWDNCLRKMISYYKDDKMEGKATQLPTYLHFIC